MAKIRNITNCYHTITQTFNANGGEINMNIIKLSSKLTRAFITLFRIPRSNKDLNRYLPNNYVYKKWNYFYNPIIYGRINNIGNTNTNDLQGKGFQDATRSLSWQIQLSNFQKYPEFKVQSLSKIFYYLRKAIHYINPDQDNLSFSYRQYKENKFIISILFEKMVNIIFIN